MILAGTCPAAPGCRAKHVETAGRGGALSDTLRLYGDEIFPAMLAAIREAKQMITFANFIYEKGNVARDMAHALAERALAGVGVNHRRVLSTSSSTTS
jgi:hypothetical protein